MGYGIAINMKEVYKDISIPQEYCGQRLDVTLTKLYPNFSRSRIKKWLIDGTILVNGTIAKPRFLVKGGEVIKLQEFEINPSELPWQVQDIKIDAVYEDESLLVINKPAGLVVHPGAGNWNGTLVNGLLHKIPKLRALPRAGIVHRLDKDTSGLMVVAKTLVAHTSLIRQIENRTVKREYFAVVNGVLTAGATINAPIGRHKHKRTKMAVVENGREAITHYRVAKKFRAHSTITVNLETGRTHQIRVHMVYKKTPLVGDKVYGGRFRLPPGCNKEFAKVLHDFPRQALHARKLGLIHPHTNENLDFVVPLPEDIENLLQALHQDFRAHETAL